jgi:hypothetical protein
VTAHGRFQRDRAGNLFAGEIAIREMGTLSLLDALAYLDLRAEVESPKLERAAIRWHARLETEALTLTIAASQLALAALASLLRRRAGCDQDPAWRRPAGAPDAAAADGVAAPSHCSSRAR